MRRMALDTMNIPAVQAWLEDWAAKGWFLKAYGAHIAQFAAGERKDGVRYRLQPVKRDEAAPDCDVQTAYAERDRFSHRVRKTVPDFRYSGSSACRERWPQFRPYFTASISPTMETASSSGVSPPRSRPMGA